MQQKSLQSKQGYPIPYCNQIGEHQKIAIISHGFGSSKNSPMVEALQNTLPNHGIGTFNFDFPAHGNSPAGFKQLRIPNCVEDLHTVDTFVRQIAPNADVYYFSSSFGAYITLLYLAAYPQKNAKAFLRSAAIDMHSIVQQWINSSTKWQKGECNSAIWDYFTPDFPYHREMKITKAFLSDLEENQPLHIYPIPSAPKLSMIHGSADTTAPIVDARRFAEQSLADLHEVSCGEHRLMAQGEMDAVIQQAISFFLEDESCK